MLRFLSTQSPFNLWVIFLIENFAVTGLSLLFGWVILKISKSPVRLATVKEWFICCVTNLINTAITYLGFWLWLHGNIIFSFDLNWRIVPDFLILFLAMDLCMYGFHYIIHNSGIYKSIHSFHHTYENPTPIDLFVLHPLETVSFGLLWLIIISLYSFNFYAVFIYLVVNVGFGIIGHLGFEPFPANIRNSLPLKYLGTSTFHHKHHLDITHNYGFYTNIWDKLFKTYKV
ncbi:Fatty acid hydroxylase superfamily protein [Mucilaginibacter mallensis]|uniref:Fatty acid hydroxylase superfamily protein n=1 Tax=Mucilaginibacter mallensis TaxID=652787 RepID=A0A1H1TXW7_MUCMA|nr:sterol desaturase family protein [Mucilaginibacter mallensis]SDS64459.1 Fatty acid hydroxylase superfamily protein [Mucilaginibacter mallensis]